VGSLEQARENDGVSLLLVGQMTAAAMATAADRWSGSGFDVALAEPTQALRQVYATRPDLIVVDCPEDASAEIELIGRLRRFSGIPIIAVVGEEDAGVHALHAGADSIAPKPVCSEELLLRARRLLDRSGRLQQILGDRVIQLDRPNHLVLVHGTELALTPTEFRLLAALMEHPEAVHSTRDLLAEAWHDPFGEEAKVKIYVGYLRRRFAQFRIDPVETVRGVGYRYRSEALAAV
jgi:DNA-binding response OmpR family regulator